MVSAESLDIHVHGPIGALTVSLPADATVASLREHIGKACGSSMAGQELLTGTGFPPRVLDDDRAPLSSALSGNRVLVRAPFEPEPEPEPEPAPPSPTFTITTHTLAEVVMHGHAPMEQEGQAKAVHGMWVSGANDPPPQHNLMVDVECRLKPAKAEADRARNAKHLAGVAKRIDAARRADKPCWVHCTDGADRGPAGAVAHPLLHTAVPRPDARRVG